MHQIHLLAKQSGLINGQLSFIAVNIHIPYPRVTLPLAAQVIVQQDDKHHPRHIFQKPSRHAAAGDDTKTDRLPARTRPTGSSA